MAKSIKQQTFEAIIQENFKNGRFDRLTNLKSLLEAYNPPRPQSTGFSSSLYNLYSGVVGSSKHYNTLANKMLSTINALSAKKAEEKVDYLLNEEMIELFQQINAEIADANPQGHFVALLNAYFYYFPEDRDYLLESSGFNKHIDRIGFDSDYTESALQEFKTNPINLFSRGLDVTSSISEMACAIFTESEILNIADKVIADAKNQHSSRFVILVLEKLVTYNSDAVKSKIRQFLFEYLMQDDTSEFDQNAIAANALHKTFEVTEAGKNELEASRIKMITTSSSWLFEAKFDNETACKQFQVPQFYLLNELVLSANEVECDIIANALLAFIPESSLTTFPAHTNKAKQYPFYQFEADEPLFRLLMELSGKISEEMAARMKVELLKLETFPKQLDPKKSLAGYMLQAFENRSVKPCAEVLTKQEVIPPDFVKEEKNNVVSAQTYAKHLFKEKTEVDYNDVNQVVAYLGNFSNERKNKEYAADRFIRFGNLMSIPARMDALRKIITWAESDIKFNIMTKFNAYNKRDKQVNQPSFTL